jgi:hypothetical protein
MAINPLKKIETLADKQADTVKLIESQLLHSYKQLSKLVYQNPHKLTVEQVVAAMSPEDAVKLRQLAILVKSIINHTNPGTITDHIPTIEVNMPENLFPEV